MEDVNLGMIRQEIRTPSPRNFSLLRQASGLTRKQAAKLIGVHPETLKSWEYGLIYPAEWKYNLFRKKILLLINFKRILEERVFIDSKVKLEIKRGDNGRGLVKK